MVRNAFLNENVILKQYTMKFQPFFSASTGTQASNFSLRNMHFPDEN